MINAYSVYYSRDSNWFYIVNAVNIISRRYKYGLQCNDR